MHQKVCLRKFTKILKIMFDIICLLPYNVIATV